jgi:hypothetical protein
MVLTPSNMQMQTEKVADDMVDYFSHTCSELMPADPFENIRVGLMIRAKVLASFVENIAQDVLIDSIKGELRKRKEIGELLYEDMY